MFGAKKKLNNSADVSSEMVSAHIYGFPPGLTVCDVYPYAYIMSDGVNFTIAKDDVNNFQGFILIHFKCHKEAKEFVSQSLYYKRGQLLTCSIVFDHEEYIKQTLNALRKPKITFINKLPRNLDKTELEEALSTFGHIDDLVMVKKDKKSKYAFITFASSSSAREAVNHGQIKIKQNILINVFYAKPKFPESFHNKIHPRLSEYITAITKGNKNYDPKQFIWLHDIALERNPKKAVEFKKILELSQNDLLPVIELIAKRKHGNSAKKELFDSSSASHDHSDTEVILCITPKNEISYNSSFVMDFRVSDQDLKDTIGQESTFINITRNNYCSNHNLEQIVAENEKQVNTSLNIPNVDQQSHVNQNNYISGYNESYYDNPTNVYSNPQWGYQNNTSFNNCQNAYNQNYEYYQPNYDYQNSYAGYDQIPYQDNIDSQHSYQNDQQYHGVNNNYYQQDNYYATTYYNPSAQSYDNSTNYCYGYNNKQSDAYLYQNTYDQSQQFEQSSGVYAYENPAQISSTKTYDQIYDKNKSNIDTQVYYQSEDQIQNTKLSENNLGNCGTNYEQKAYDIKGSNNMQIPRKELKQKHTREPFQTLKKSNFYEIQQKNNLEVHNNEFHTEKVANKEIKEKCNQI